MPHIEISIPERELREPSGVAILKYVREDSETSDLQCMLSYASIYPMIGESQHTNRGT